MASYYVVGEKETIRVQKLNYDHDAISALTVALLPVFRPEAYGAKGDGATDDSLAFSRMSTALNTAGGGKVALTPNVTYIVGLQALSTGHQLEAGGYTYPPTVRYPVHFDGCTRGAVLEGNGARIKCKPSAKYGTFNDNGTVKASVGPYYLGGLATPYWAMIRAHNCSGGVWVHDVELDGNIASATIGGEYDNTGRQIAMVGIMVDANTSSVVVDRVKSHHHGLDGIETIWAGADENDPTYRVTLRDSDFLNNGRQGLSWVGGKGVTAINCRFNDTGKDIGSLPCSAPGAGMDVEAEASICRDGSFINCEFSNNTGVGAIHVGDVARIHYHDSRFIGTTSHAIWVGAPYVTYTDCLVAGAVVNAWTDADPAKATQFVRTRFTNDPTLSPTGTVYDYGGYILNLGGGDENVLFDDCSVDIVGASGLGVGAIYSNGSAIFRNFTLTQTTSMACYPRGKFYGENTLTSVGVLDDYTSPHYGTTTINGTVRPTTVVGDLYAGIVGAGAFVERVFSIGPTADPGYATPASVNIRTWGASPQANVNFWNNGSIKASIDADFNSGNMNFKGLDIPGGGTYYFWNKTLTTINFSIDPAGNAAALGTVTGTNLTSGGFPASVATATIVGRSAGGTGAASALSATTVTSMLNAFTGDSGSGGVKGLVPAPAAGDAAAGKYLAADGTWSAPAGGGGGGTTTNAVTFTTTGGAGAGTTFNGSVARTIDYSTVGAAKTGAITASNLTMATARLLGRTTAATGAVEEITAGATLTLSAGSLGVAKVPNAVTFDTTGGAASGSTFDGSAAKTVDYSTVGAAKTGAVTGSGLTMSTGTLLYRKTAATGAIEEQTLATLKTDLGLTGTNSGDQTITLTGNVTGSGTGSFATTIAAGAVTRAMMANTAAATVLGSTAAGAVAELTASQARTVLGLVTVASSGLASDLTGTLAAAQMPALTGDVTTSAGSVATTVGKINGVSLAGLATGILKNTTTTGAPSIAVAGDFPTLNQNTTGSAATLTTSRNFSISGGGITAAAVGFNGSAAVVLSASVDASHITLVRMADVATGTVFYRKTAGTGAPEVQTLATLKTDLALAAIATSGSGADLTAASVTLAKIANAAASSKLLGSGSSGSGASYAELSLGANLSVAATTVNAIPSGSSGNLQYNSSSTFAGAANLSVDASGNLAVVYASATTTPPADSLAFVPQRLLASGGRVLPRWQDENGVLTTLMPHFGRNSVAWMVGTGSTTVTITGINMATAGTATSRVPAGTNKLTRTRRTAYVSAATAGAAGGLYSGTLNPYSLGSGTIAGGGGFFAVFRWGCSDAAGVAGAHMFVGMKNDITTPGVTTNPNTFTNAVGVAQLNGGTNLQIVYGGSAAQTPIDLGANFPAAGLSTDLYEMILYAPPTSNNTVYYRVERINTGNVASGTLTGTAGTVLPSNTTFMGPRLYRTNNATALAVGIDIAGFTVESDFV